VESKAGEGSIALILVGSPQTNPEVAHAAGQNWPKLSNQGFVLRRLKVDSPTMILGGGSPAATLWAVYELGERLGVRYLARQDLFPPKRKLDGLPDLDLVLEPNMRTRCWRLVNELADGPVSWSLDENKQFLRQMAKMKYNRIHLSFWPCQPFVQYRFRGMDKPPAKMFFGSRYPIDNDTIGLEKFHGMTEFTNPEFVGAKSPEDLVQRAVGLARGILQEARSLGMETGLSIQPFEWPREFMKVLPGSEPAHQAGELTAGPGKDQSTDDPLLREMVATIIRAYVETYPEADIIHIGMPEHRSWMGKSREAYDLLKARYGLEGLGTYEELCARARARTSFPGGGGRVETMLKGDLSSLWFLDSLVREKKLLSRPGRDDVRIVYCDVVEELFPLVARMIPPGGEVLSFIDYTASRQLMQRSLLKQTPPKHVPANLVFTLADDNVGVLPQLATGSLHELLKDLRGNGWSGFYTRYWTIGDLDPTIHYLACASWDARVTPETAYRDLVEHVCGATSVAPALEAWQTIEQITRGLDHHGLGFGFPVPGMMTKHYEAGSLTREIRADRDRYAETLKQMKIARERSAPAGHRFLDYFVGRLTFAVKYLDAAEEFGATARAEKAGDRLEAARQVHRAYGDIRDALTAYVNVACDHGDLGAVALMNEFCYRPIRDKMIALAGGAEIIERVPVGKKGDYKPCIARLPSGELLLVAFHQNQLDGNKKIREDILLFRSRDGGKAWSDAQVFADLPGREPYLTVLEDGTLLMTVHLLPQDIRNKEGYTHCYVHRSQDGGRTWTTTRTQPEGVPPRTETVTSRNVLQLADGSLMLCVSGNRRGLDFTWRSTDGGRTWAEKHRAKVEGVRDDYPFQFFGEAVLWQARAGKIYAIVRVDSRFFPPLKDRSVKLGESDHYDRMILFGSTDMGRTWGPERDFGDYGEMYPAVLRLRDGRLLLTFTVREVKRPLGVRAVLGSESADGFDFDFDFPRFFVDARTPNDKDSGGGFGRTVQLDDGSLATSYSYRGQDNDVHCEVVRWRLPPTR
jgi:hypothetical protein